MPLTQVPSGMLQTTAQYYSFKNRIINGEFKISQYNGSNSITPSDGPYIIDRFFWNQSISGKFTFQQNSGSVTPPIGFVNYVGFTSTSAYSLLSSDYWVFRQKTEGFNVSDFAWGTANAKTVTMSFWVYCSLTGTFGGIIQNQLNNYNYTFSYTINAANTWQYVTITIPGPTAGTWYSDNRAGIDLWFCLGCGSTNTGSTGTWGSPRIFAPTGQVNVSGTNGAVWNITGIQLEVGTQATSFDYRPYGTELALCQRYYQLVSAFNGGGNSTTQVAVNFPFQTAMRAAPTLSVQGPIQISDSTADYLQSSANITGLNFNITSAVCFLANFTGLTVTRVCFGPRLAANNNTITLSAEL